MSFVVIGDSSGGPGRVARTCRAHIVQSEDPAPDNRRMLDFLRETFASASASGTPLRPVHNTRAKAKLSRGSERYFFFFQAEDGIRDVAVTGVQTCALPI